MISGRQLLMVAGLSAGCVPARDLVVFDLVIPPIPNTRRFEHDQYYRGRGHSGLLLVDESIYDSFFLTTFEVDSQDAISRLDGIGRTRLMSRSFEPGVPFDDPLLREKSCTVAEDLGSASCPSAGSGTYSFDAVSIHRFGD